LRRPETFLLPPEVNLPRLPRSGPFERPFQTTAPLLPPKKGKIAVEVINHDGVEVLA
jgi:hypothetical protein